MCDYAFMPKYRSCLRVYTRLEMGYFTDLYNEPKTCNIFFYLGAQSYQLTQ